MPLKQHMVKTEDLKFDYQLTTIKQILIQTVRNGEPTLENDLEKPSLKF